MLRLALVLLVGTALVAAVSVTLRQGRVGSAVAQGGSWLDLAPLSEPRQEVGVAALDGNIYAIGGFRADGSTTGAVEMYDPVADRWSTVAPLPVAAHHVAAAAVAGQVYAIGGFAGPQWEPTAAVFAYDPSANRWSRRAPMPTARGGLAVVAADGRIYAAGGSPGEQDFAVYDPSADAWTALPPMPTPRNHLAAAAIDGKVYVVGGRSTTITGALEEFDPATNAWTTRAPMPTARGGIGGAALDGLLYVFGGENNRLSPVGMFDETEVYDPTTDAWARLQPMAVPVHGIGAAAVGNRIYIPGGAVVEGFGAVAVNQAFEPN